ncbi:MAG: tetratricopeptide repeat protein [Caldilineaceae bacterium]|nr:tetratricopeptide repeat protein [Caldilineaceae bacterium]
MLAGLAQWRALGNPSSMALGLNYISPTAIRLGRLGEAQAFLQESLDLLTQVGDLWGMGTTYRLLGLAALAQGDTDLALAHIRHSLELFSGYITGWDIAQSLIYLGQATLAAGDTVEARRIFFEAYRVAQEAQPPPLMLDLLVALAHLQLQTGNLETAMRLACLALDHPAGIEATQERARWISAEAGLRLTVDQAQAARAWAASASLSTAADLLSE